MDYVFLESQLPCLSIPRRERGAAAPALFRWKDGAASWTNRALNAPHPTVIVFPGKRIWEIALRRGRVRSQPAADPGEVGSGVNPRLIQGKWGQESTRG